MRKSLYLVLLLAATLGMLTLTGCGRDGFDYEYAVNNRFIQIGCAGHLNDQTPPKTPPGQKCRPQKLC